MSTVVVNSRLKTLHEALRLNIGAVKDAAVVADVVYREQEKSLFASEGASGGSTWAPLSPAYKARKDRLFAGAEATVKGIAKARGRKLTGFAVAAALGAENKILQLTGDMKRKFSTQTSGHIAEGFILPQGARIQMGAQGPEHFGLHARGAGSLPKRDPQQRTAEGDAALVAGVRRALIPHIVRTLRDALRTGAPRPGGTGA